jgi:hypothetical protein
MGWHHSGNSVLHHIKDLPGFKDEIALFQALL